MLADKIIAFEQGEMDSTSFLNLFSELVANGQAWTLGSHYCLTARNLIDAGYLNEEGGILKRIDNSDF